MIFNLFNARPLRGRMSAVGMRAIYRAKTEEPSSRTYNVSKTRQYSQHHETRTVYYTLHIHS